MATITHPHPYPQPHPDVLEQLDVGTPADARAQAPGDGEQVDRAGTSTDPEPVHRLRDVVPAAVSVLLLFGLLMGGAFLLRDAVDLGLWLVTTR